MLTMLKIACKVPNKYQLTRYFVLAQKRAMYKDMYFVPKLKISVLHVPPERMFKVLRDKMSRNLICEPSLISLAISEIFV